MSVDPFDEAGASVGGNRPPTIAQLGTGAQPVVRDYAPGTEKEITGIKTSGRLIAFIPVDLDKGMPAPTPGKFQDRMSVDMVVFDGDTIATVLDKDGEPVFTPEEPWVAPFRLEQVFVSQVMLIGQLLTAYKNGSTIIGRLGKLPKNNNGYRAWAILSVTPEERAAAIATFTALQRNPFDE
jgi:hypothetical protein